MLVVLACNYSGYRHHQAFGFGKMLCRIAMAPADVINLLQADPTCIDVELLPGSLGLVLLEEYHISLADNFELGDLWDVPWP